MSNHLHVQPQLDRYGDTQPDGSALRVVKAADFESRVGELSRTSFTLAAAPACLTPVLTGTVAVQGRTPHSAQRAL